jgi:hypothetical protein
MIAQGLVKMKKVIKDGGIQPDWYCNRAQ